MCKDRQAKNKGRKGMELEVNMQMCRFAYLAMKDFGY
jgi:hypothetical protein